MVPKTTHKMNDTTVSSKLYLALELSQAEWKLGFTIGLGQARHFPDSPYLGFRSLARWV
jgi:hypothetical protein